jgi:rhomboid protease GluP
MTDQPPLPRSEQPQSPVHVKMPTRKPTVTYALIGVTTLVFILQYLVEAATGTDLLFIYGGKINVLIMEGQFWRLLTPVLLHGSILHITFNLYALYVIGRRLELFYGHGRFLLLYILSAIAGNVLSFVLTPAPSLGASTAIFGLLAAEGIFIFQNRKLFGAARTQQAILNLGAILMINLAYGFMQNTNVDNMGHIGGLIGGVFFAWQGGPLLKVTGMPPIFEVVDVRKNREVLVASVVVIIGFALIAMIPFVIS